MTTFNLTGWAIAKDHFGYRGCFLVSLLVGEEKQREGKKKKLPILLLRTGKQMMLEKGLMRISEISDEKAVVHPPLDKL